MQNRVVRTITKTIVAVGTASAVATACWLLNRILDGNDHKCIEDAKVEREDERGGYCSEEEQLDTDSFALLPVISESDDESDEDAMDYTADYFTPHYDVCMLSVSVQTRVDPLQDVPTEGCRLCRAASECVDTTSDGIDLHVDEKPRTLSFADTDSSDGSVLSIASEWEEYNEEEKSARTEQWLLLANHKSEVLGNNHKDWYIDIVSFFILQSIAMSTFKPRQVTKNFQAVGVSDGDGARLRRSIGCAHLQNLDPFLILDEFSLAEPAGFPDHPHRGFQTVTYVFPKSKGGMLHEDFMGNKGERAGDLQWMTAGRGIMHAEMPSSTEPACGLQLWINLPSKYRMIKPHYQEISRDSVSHVFNEDKSVEAVVFAGEVFGHKGPIETEAPVTYVHFSLKPGATMEYTIPKSHNVFVYGVSGTGKCAGVDIREHEAIVLDKEGDGVLLNAAKNGSLDVVVMTGEPLNEPVSQYGPFVMSTREEIAQTLRDFDLRTNGFEDAHGWRSELSMRR